MEVKTDDQPIPEESSALTIERLTAQLKEKEEFNSKLRDKAKEFFRKSESEKTALQSQVNSLQQNVAQLQASIDQLTQNNQKQNDEWSKAVQSKLENIQVLEDNLGESRKRISSLQAESEALRLQKIEISTVMDSMRRDYDGLTRTCETDKKRQQMQSTQISAEVETLRHLLQESESKLSRDREKIRTAESNLNEAQGEESKTRKSITDLNRYFNLDPLSPFPQSIIQIVTSTAKSRADEVEALNHQKSTMSDRITEMTRTIDGLQLSDGDKTKRISQLVRTLEENQQTAIELADRYRQDRLNEDSRVNEVRRQLEAAISAQAALHTSELLNISNQHELLLRTCKVELDTVGKEYETYKEKRGTAIKTQMISMAEDLQKLQSVCFKSRNMITGTILPLIREEVFMLERLVTSLNVMHHPNGQGSESTSHMSPPLFDNSSDDGDSDDHDLIRYLNDINLLIGRIGAGLTLSLQAVRHFSSPNNRHSIMDGSGIENWCERLNQLLSSSKAQPPIVVSSDQELGRRHRGYFSIARSDDDLKDDDSSTSSSRNGV